MKLLDILFEQEKILIPRRSKEEHQKNHIIATQKKIQQYIKNGSKGDLKLDNTPITSLPDNLTHVGGSLYLFRSKITSLPDNLKVRKLLYLANTPITSLPTNLEVRGSLFLMNTPLSKKYTKEEIKKMVPGVKGRIIL